MKTRGYSPVFEMLLFCAAVLAFVGARSEPQLPEVMYQSAFDAWVDHSRAVTAVVAVRRQGETIFLKGHGVDPKASSLIGSMSKPITGVCVGTLIRDGKLAFTTPLRQALAGFFRRHGPPLDRRLETVTIEQLLTHRSGLLGNAENDPMHEIWRRRATQGLAHIASPEPLLVEHFKYPLVYEPGTRSSYSNTGFIVLTSVIEEASGRSYEDYCRAAVFERLNITSAHLDPDWRQFSGSRGWVIAPADYLAFLDVYDASAPFLGEVVKNWIAKGETRWAPEYQGQFEGLGIPTLIVAGGWMVQHSGILNFTGLGGDGRPIEAVIHSYAYREPSGFSVFHAMTPAQDDDALSELAEAIHRTHEVNQTVP